MNNIIVLGAGMVGNAIAIDLAKNHLVTLTDLNQNVLDGIKLKNEKIHIQQLDVTDITSLKKAIIDFDLVVCAVPGFLGFNTVKIIIEAGKNVVDISFFSENSLELDALAKENNVTAIVDCGVAPGMSNLILGYYNEKLKISDFECIVGGLPKEKKWPFYYKAPFSPVDVIEEYMRPARLMQGGKEFVHDAMTDCEYVVFDKIGTLESFNSDGLRSIIYTLPHIPNMKEKTLRYPRHVEYIKVLKESGFFNDEEILVNGTLIKPIDFTSKILFNEWKLGKNEEELTVMRITIKGENSNGEIEEITYNLHDEYCRETKTSSMARTTGYTATATANMFLAGLFSEKGVFPPELIGKNENCFKFILDYLKQRNIHYIKSTRIL